MLIADVDFLLMMTFFGSWLCSVDKGLLVMFKSIVVVLDLLLLFVFFITSDHLFAVFDGSLLIFPILIDELFLLNCDALLFVFVLLDAFCWCTYVWGVCCLFST